MPNSLMKIIDNKKREVEQLYQKFDKQCVRSHIKSLKEALKKPAPNIIAEIKRESPSKGPLASINNPVQLAKKYLAGGASAISVLTDTQGFGGSLDELKQVAQSLVDTDMPILRKDFIIDEIQIDESFNAGADAILLIVSILKDKTDSFLQYAKKLGIDALVEVYDKHELQYAINIGSEIIGINNRNLNTFKVDTNNAIKLKPYIPETIVSVAESGIHTKEDVQRYIDLGFNGVLIGEALVKASNPKTFIQSIRSASCHHH